MLVLVGPVGLDAVGGPGQHHRVALGLILGDIDRREEFLAVSHGNAIFELSVVTLDIIQPLARGLLVRGQPNKQAD